MQTLTTNTARFEELKKNPLLFLKKVNRSYTDQNGEYVEQYKWLSVDKDFQGELSEDSIHGNDVDYALVVVEEEKKDSNNNQENNTVHFGVHSINPGTLDDWRIAINSFIIRSQNREDKFPYIHLLWMLNNCQWNRQQIQAALIIYDVQAQPFVINQALSKICRCLSMNKQGLIRQALSGLGYDYNEYYPAVLNEALRQISSERQHNISNWNLFKSVDYVLESTEQGIKRNVVDNTTNPFLCLYRWLHSDDIGFEYDLLRSLFSVVSPKIQMKIVKRYFHDIHLGKTTFDQNLVSQFKDNDFAIFIRYRYCLETPEEPINLAVPLLCDCCLTIDQTKGRSFQSFDGILDFAMNHCDVTKPSIELGLEELIPKCHGGAVYNPEFKGFIDYNVVCEIDENKFTVENLQSTILDILNRRPHQRYYACSLDQQKRPLTQEELSHCCSKRTVEDKVTGNKRTEQRFSCVTTYPIENKWMAYDSDYEWLNTILKEPLPKVENNTNKHNPITIDINQTSTEVLKSYILSLTEQYEKVDDRRFVLSSNDFKRANLLTQFSHPVSIRLIPLSVPIVGMNFDVFGFLKTIYEEKGQPNNITDDIKEEFIKRESEELRRRVIDSLKQELNIQEFNGLFFEIDYDRKLLIKLISLYYFKGSMPDKPYDSFRTFLKKKNTRYFQPFCAPELAKSHNRVTDMPFFWCWGLECFKNNLNEQKLINCSSWSSYSLYHVIETMGYPMLKQTEAGYEPEGAVIEFIACATRAIKKFKRLKCRDCGHLLYTYSRDGYSRFNYYSCINPTCRQYNQPVYLSYCYKCKKGLIDSRDCVRCPNNWYICPTCHACCDDAQYERQAQRYIVQNRRVPKRIEDMLGHGHNDKGIYFCHKCGSLLQSIDDSGQDKWFCSQCRETYNR